jgi:hypothetical protein
MGVGMALVDGDELGAKAQPDYGDVNFSIAHALRIDITSDGPQDSSFKGLTFGDALNDTIPAPNCQRQISAKPVISRPIQRIRTKWGKAGSSPP